VNEAGRRTFGRLALCAGAILAGALGGTGFARASEAERPLVEMICPLMEREAERNGLPPAFFMRLIWRESAFRPDVVSHKGAQGIAQFMPVTAQERGLEDPFDPASAIPHSARLLADLRREFGNLGLSAAAYNAGPERVRAWLEGRRTLPAETRAYVQFITGHAAESWKDAGTEPEEPDKLTSTELQKSCRQRAPTLLRVSLPAKSTVAKGSRPPWGVQLAAAFTQARLASILGSLRQRHARLLGDAEPMFVAERNLSRGRKAMIALRVGAESRDDALKLCQSLRTDGGICTVQKN